MRLTLPLLLFAAVCALPVFAANEADVRTPVLLELFTSEGCSSCPPADRLLQTLDRTQPVPGADIIVLSEHVDYWDQLGWRDRFSAAQYSERQRAYSSNLHTDDVYTPQLIIDGRHEVLGSDASAAKTAIAQSSRQPKVPVVLSQVKRDGAHLTFHIQTSQAAKGAVVYVALADERADTEVKRGENSGRSLSHIAVVRLLRESGTVARDGSFDKTLDISLPNGAGEHGLRLVAFLQERGSGKVLGISQQKL